MIPWGGTINMDGVSVHITNTCSFDNVVFVLYALYKTVLQVHDCILNLRSVGDMAAKILIKSFSRNRPQQHGSC